MDNLLKLLMVDDASVLKWGRFNFVCGLTCGFLLIALALVLALAGRAVAADQEKVFQSIIQRLRSAEEGNPHSSVASRNLAEQEEALLRTYVGFMNRLPWYIAFVLTLQGVMAIINGVLFARFKTRLENSQQPHAN